MRNKKLEMRSKKVGRAIGRLTFSFLISLFLISHSSAYSQIVNIESARMQSDTTGWQGTAGAGMALTKNTQQIFSANIDAHLQYKTRKDLWLLLGDYVLLKSDGQKFISNEFLHLRYNHKLNSWLRWEVFTQLQSNSVTQIDHRFLVGTGPRFKVASSKKFKLYIASLVMYENEKEITEPPVIHNDIRNSSYISLIFLPADNIELSSTFFYQPLLKNFNDHRYFNQSSLTVKAGKHFGLYITWNYLYDRFPAGVSPKTNYDLRSGIQFSF
jgi:hypothetical protein